MIVASKQVGRQTAVAVCLYGTANGMAVTAAATEADSSQSNNIFFWQHIHISSVSIGPRALIFFGQVHENIDCCPPGQMSIICF